ncbi:MAG: LVIVD repeat-containing protein, partial [Chitinophagales bacterium]
MHLFTMHAQENVTFRGQVQYDVHASDVWGYTDPIGNEFAIIGLNNGTSIVDISDPDNPVEVAFVEGPESIWRDIKTWEHYAYITNETDSGLHIIDLQNLPASVESRFFQDAGLNTAHNLWIDENGICYIWGSNLYNGGAVFIDLNANPWNPEIIGGYDLEYCHDGFVRGDTMYTAEIYAGNFVIVDISDKSNLVVLGQHPTSSAFTHNVWPSADSKYLFTTDEVSGAYIGAYDITDLADIDEVGRYRSSPGSGVIPHNTHWHNNYLINSYYR